MIKETEEVKYVIKVNGQVVSIPYTSEFLAQQNIANLSPDQQMLAEVVAVTPDGKELLFG